MQMDFAGKGRAPRAGAKKGQARMGGAQKGQALIDYLMVLMILLVVTLAFMGLSELLPVFGQSVHNTQNADFWKLQARPMAVADATYHSNDSRLYLALVMQEDDAFNLSGLYVNGTRLAFYAYDPTASDGLGTLYCDSSSCSGGCTCAAAIKPHTPLILVTEPYSSVGVLCGPNRQQGSVVPRLTYYRPTDASANFTEKGLVELPISCS